MVLVAVLVLVLILFPTYYKYLLNSPHARHIPDKEKPKKSKPKSKSKSDKLLQVQGKKQSQGGWNGLEIQPRPSRSLHSSLRRSTLEGAPGHVTYRTVQSIYLVGGNCLRPRFLGRLVQSQSITIPSLVKAISPTTTSEGAKLLGTREREREYETPLQTRIEKTRDEMR